MKKFSNISYQLRQSFSEASMLYNKIMSSRPASQELKRGESTHSESRNSFTLIELLVVLAIVAILSVVVIMTLNPAELVKQARDSTRLSDLSTLNTALAAFGADVTNGFAGTSTVVYVSIPDTSQTCVNLGLPSLPSGYTYNCVTSANLRKTNGTGWIPVNLQNVSFGTPISALPIDPINTTSSRLYYTYITGGSFELSSTLEAAKNKLGGSTDKTSSDGGNMPDMYEVGTNKTLMPVDYGDPSLVGYWNFEEGTNATSPDRSGYGNNGTWYGGGTHYVAGKVGNYSSQFNGTNDYVEVPDSARIELTSAASISYWIKSTNATGGYFGTITKYSVSGVEYGYDMGMYIHTAVFNVRSGASGDSAGAWGPTNIDDGLWHYIVGVFSGSQATVYVDGVAGTPVSWNYPSAVSSAPLRIGTRNAVGEDFPGVIDDARVYNRALSAAEIMAMYNATK